MSTKTTKRKTPVDHERIVISFLLNDSIRSSMDDVQALDEGEFKRNKHKIIVKAAKDLFVIESKPPERYVIAQAVYDIAIQDGYSKDDAGEWMDFVQDFNPSASSKYTPSQMMDAFSVMGLTDAQQHGSAVFPDTFNGRVLGTADNLAELLRSLGLKATLNEMNLGMELVSTETLEPVCFELEDARSLVMSESEKAGLPRRAFDEHFKSVAGRNKYHPVKRWLEEDEWDSKPRVLPLINAMNARDTNLARVVMTKFFTACVAALYEKSFVGKLVPVLQGGQSFKKSAFISRFARVGSGAYLEGESLNPEDKDSVSKVVKAWIVELGELEQTTKRSQGALKAFITRSSDVFRPPYARTEVSKPRKTTLIGTVNGTGFLRDETGSDRYAVIEHKEAVNMEAVNSILGWEYNEGRITQSRPDELRQFWLEVKRMYDSGSSWHLTEKELSLITKANEEHDAKTPAFEFLEDMISGADSETHNYRWMSSSEIIELVPSLRVDNAVSVGKALSKLEKVGLIESRTLRARRREYYLPLSVKVRNTA
ncbi:virulence-associated E family protein [Vibrio sp. 1CM2L]|uniref:virulence-associated E family protein n=1 Tax=Vibrio sp. 1CM2L TaxID=2929166 RepID=UPI0020BDBDBB|nr:virulence-associated E family protein [Vibrio sp. 1CM2L]MCK8078336.1 virulence-associated E family protein [Vibrio sp. 1CM2L]